MAKQRISKLKVVERKLGREEALGLCWKKTGLIEIDPQLESKAHLDTLIHEMLHLYFPEEEEWRIAKVATKMATVLWTHRYRRLQK
jgi:hypothetical protein